MRIPETLKEKFEQLTGIGKPSVAEARKAARKVEPERFLFKDDGAIPNNPKLPFLVYKDCVKLEGAADPAAIFEALFASRGWGQSWRNGVYPYAHYHSRIHEVLGVARGTARVRFGGKHGKELTLGPGDVAVLPAGTGHQCIKASDDFLVVGAYPPKGEYDECRERADEHARALESIPKTPLPEQDPVFGRRGPLKRLWRR